MTTTLGAIDLPFDEAIAYLRAKANVTSESYTDVWGKANVKSFTVAGATTQALVGDFRSAVAKALENGTSIQDFRKQFDSIVEKHGWAHTGKAGYRARLIYNVNLGMAYSAGRYAQQVEPETLAAFPYWQYVHSGALHPRLHHLAWNGITLRADDGWWTTHYAPNGYHCGCWIRSVSARGLARMGKSGPDTAPPVHMIEHTIRKTGEVIEVPEGIDPGFDYNVGQEWLGKAPQIPANATLTVPAARAPAPVPTPATPVRRRRSAAPSAPAAAAPPSAPPPPPAAPPPTSPPADGAWPWTPRPRETPFELHVSPDALKFGLFKNETEAQRLAAQLMAGVPEKLAVTAEWRMSGREVLKLTLKHREVILDRSFWRGAEGLVVEHDYFWVDPRHQGGGHALRMLQTSFSAYDRLGVARVEVHANLDKGGYVWARNGFATTEPRQMRAFFRRMGDHLDPGRREQLAKTVEGSADLDLMYNVSLLSDEQAPWGKQILLGSDWYGAVDLRNPQHRALLGKALGR